MILEKIHEEGMIPGERGIMSKKGIYFHSPPSLRRSISSAYTGELNISVHRPTRSAERVCTLTFFSAFCQGNLHFTYRDHSFTAATGDIVLLDCMYPHHYYTPKQVRFQFFTLTATSPLTTVNISTKKTEHCSVINPRPR